MKPYSLPLLILSVVTLPSLLLAEAEDVPNEFDFWVGHWDLTWKGDLGGGKGKNEILKILGDQVVQENFTTMGDQPFKGQSYTVFNKTLKVWEQTWVDNAGGYLTFQGKMEGDTMVLYGTRQAKRPDGSMVDTRMVFKEIKKDSLTWSWEASADEGKTWQVNWEIRYVRRGSGGR